MSDTVLSSKGQLVIPLEVRRRLGLKAGDHFECNVADGRIILVPRTSGAAVLEIDEDGLPVLKAPEGAPEMSPEAVKAILSNFP